MGNPESSGAAKHYSPELAELRQAVEGLPPEARVLVEPSMRRMEESMERKRATLRLVQDALAQLRLDMKYLIFDVEATRRERDEARERVQELEGRG